MGELKTASAPKRAYQVPEVSVLGTVRELTQQGCPTPPENIPACKFLGSADFDMPQIPGGPPFP